MADEPTRYEALAGDALKTAVASLNVGWSALPGRGLVRVVETPGFDEGFDLVGKIVQAARRHNHHPEITLRYGEVEIALTTHEAGGITDADVRLARELDGLIAGSLADQS
ncbi:MAG: 4a-hydroxytetrahydrobiopterin dehydratase [Candidatus Chaera renei]|uniref:4a-hydroxytetrahydrobiopterin dehydratase n=1 Tax=Candidatus Chaera renei TaxID=2506947 RepID=A0A4Q0AJM4_9BACT|nr:MAG: 4a-hydroxytetrahydrobiopterin dehydratase [Candidatus Chaera renei]